jgi:hypothetical protein
MGAALGKCGLGDRQSGSPSILSIKSLDQPRPSIGTKAYNALIERLIETGTDELAEPEVGTTIDAKQTEEINTPAAA